MRPNINEADWIPPATEAALGYAQIKPDELYPSIFSYVNQRHALPKTLIQAFHVAWWKES